MKKFLWFLPAILMMFFVITNWITVDTPYFKYSFSLWCVSFIYFLVTVIFLKEKLLA